MALPTSRNTTYSPGVSPVKGNDLNSIQDAIVGMKKPSLVRQYGPMGSGIWPTAPASINQVANGETAGNYFISTAATGRIVIYFDTEVGDRVTGLTVRAYGDGVVDCTHIAGYVDIANSQVQALATATDTNRAAAYGDFPIAPFTPRIMQAGELFACVVNINAANYRIAKWFLTYDRL